MLLGLLGCLGLEVRVVRVVALGLLGLLAGGLLRVAMAAQGYRGSWLLRVTGDRYGCSGLQGVAMASATQL